MAAPRTSFVTVVATILIVLAALATAVTLLQVVLVFTLFSDAGTAAAEAGMTGVSASAFAHARAIGVSALLGSTAMLIAAIGVLRRREWARRLLVLLMFLGIVYLIIVAALQWNYAGVLATDRATSQATSFLVMVRGFGLLMAVTVAGVLAWLIRKLRSASVRAEFE